MGPGRGRLPCGPRPSRAARVVGVGTRAPLGLMHVKSHYRQKLAPFFFQWLQGESLSPSNFRQMGVLEL